MRSRVGLNSVVANLALLRRAITSLRVALARVIRTALLRVGIAALARPRPHRPAVVIDLAIARRRLATSARHRARPQHHPARRLAPHA